MDDVQFLSWPHQVGHGVFNTDKVAQNYVGAYLEINQKLGQASAICEVGVLCGGSLNMWQELQPTALIVGVDNNENSIWPDGTTKVISDQVHPDLPRRLQELSPKYDLIVDDASHLAPLTFKTWELLWPLVEYGGYYVIEDWHVAFKGNPWHRELGAGWMDYVKELLYLFDQPHQLGIVSIEFRYGMIIFRKRNLWRS